MLKNELNTYEEIGVTKFIEISKQFYTNSNYSEIKSTIEFLFKTVINTEFPTKFTYSDGIVVEFKPEVINERCKTLKRLGKKKLKIILEYVINSSRIIGYGYSFRIFCLNFYRHGYLLLQQTKKHFEDELNCVNENQKQKSFQHIPHKIKWMTLNEYKNTNPEDILNELIYPYKGKWIHLKQ